MSDWVARGAEIATIYQIVPDCPLCGETLPQTPWPRDCELCKAPHVLCSGCGVHIRFEAPE